LFFPLRNPAVIKRRKIPISCSLREEQLQLTWKTHSSLLGEALEAVCKRFKCMWLVLSGVVNVSRGSPINSQKLEYTILKHTYLLVDFLFDCIGEQIEIEPILKLKI